MRWDPLLARAVARELDRTLHRGRARALLLEPEARRILLFLRDGTLVLELHPTAGWITLLDAREPPPEARPLAARVVGVGALPDESALVFGLERVRGKDEGVEIVAEFVGNRWNGLVVGHRSRQIRHVLVPRREPARVLAVGERYRPPSGTGRAGADGTLTRRDWEARVGGNAGGGPERPPEEDPRRALLRGVAYTSSLNAPCFLDPEGGPRPDGVEAWRRALDPDGWRPLLLEVRGALQPYPIPVPGASFRPVPSLMDGMAEARRASDAPPEEGLLVPAGLLRRGEARAKRARRRAESLQRELASTGDPGPERALGDLILARYGEIPAGQARVVLTDFDGSPTEIELDPALPPHENARKHYDEAARLERARETLPDRIRRAEAEAGEWADLVARVQSGEEAPEALAARLGPGAPGRPGEHERAGPGGRGADRAAALPYRRYRSSGGLEIRVGRGARKNDDLTFRHSAPDDIWLHARQAAGAHVILRWGRADNPPARDLQEAAVLAALGSEARHSGVVPVDWTRRKYVRKPRKAAPGAVLPDRVETLFVEPDPSLSRRLADARD